MSMPAGVWQGFPNPNGAGHLYLPVHPQEGRSQALIGGTGPVDPGPVNPGPSDPLPPLGNDRYTGPLPDRGSIQPFLELAGSTAGLGRDVVVPHGRYSAGRLVAERTGWLNLVAEHGDGSVLIEGTHRTDGRMGIRYIGFDINGQWSINQTASGPVDLAWWYGFHINPDRLGYAGVNKQPAVFQWHGTQSRRSSIFGPTIARSAQDLVKANGAQELLLQGIMFVDTKWNWTAEEKAGEGYHSDGFQTTNKATVKILDSFFAEDARIQLAQEFGYPQYTYFARTWVQGVPSFGVTNGSKGQPEGPYLLVGPGFYVAPKANDWSSAAGDSDWRWANRYGPLNNSGTLVNAGGSIIQTPPPGYNASKGGIRARDVTSSPEKVWRRANPFSSWKTWFAQPKSTFAGAEGQSFFP